ncbi:hypothetical protein ACJZ2D_003968 [Fusarium nematophilum]
MEATVASWVDGAGSGGNGTRPSAPVSEALCWGHLELKVEPSRRGLPAGDDVLRLKRGLRHHGIDDRGWLVSYGVIVVDEQSHL